MKKKHKEGTCKVLGRSVVFSAFYADFLFLLQISDYHHLKVVISGKYENLNKITKNLTYLPENSQTSYFCYSPQFTIQNRGTCCLKKCFNTERSKGNFVRENLKK